MLICLVNSFVNACFERPRADGVVHVQMASDRHWRHVVSWTDEQVVVRDGAIVRRVVRVAVDVVGLLGLQARLVVGIWVILAFTVHISFGYDLIVRVVRGCSLVWVIVVILLVLVVESYVFFIVAIIIFKFLRMIQLI